MVHPLVSVYVDFCPMSGVRLVCATPSWAWQRKVFPLFELCGLLFHASLMFKSVPLSSLDNKSGEHLFRADEVPI